jgi:hypothetical protein
MGKTTGVAEALRAARGRPWPPLIWLASSMGLSVGSRHCALHVPNISGKTLEMTQNA